MVNQRTFPLLFCSGMSLMAIGVVATVGILRSADWLPPIDSEAGQSLLKNYNTTSHLLFITLLIISCRWLLQLANISRSRGLTEVEFDMSSYQKIWDYNEKTTTKSMDGINKGLMS